MNESEIKGITGGMSFANVIYNITRLLEDHNSSYNNNEDKKIDFETIIYGVCGNDIPGDIIIKELELGNINTSYITRKDNKKTREFYMYLDENDNFLTSKKKILEIFKKILALSNNLFFSRQNQRFHF